MSASPRSIEDEPMLLDDDAEGEDQLIDDDQPDHPSARMPASAPADVLHHPSLSTPGSARSTPGPSSGNSPASHKQASKRKRIPDAPPQLLLEKSAKKREQREREKEQQKLILTNLIDIFEAGGGTCAIQQGVKKFPWVELPTQLIKIGKYFSGWPQICLPKMKSIDRIDASTGPSQWSLKQKRAMEVQINKGAVQVLSRAPGRAVIFETVDEHGNVKDSTIGFSDDWVRRKLLGETLPTPDSSVHRFQQQQQQLQHHQHHQSQHSAQPRYPLEHHLSSEVGYGSNSHTLPPIRAHPEPKERLELPSIASVNGMRTPDNLSRSPSPSSSYSDSTTSRLHTLHPSLRQGHFASHSHSHGRSSYPTPLSSQDEVLHVPSRGRLMTLEHGLPRTAVSMRSTSRQTSSSHGHGYPPLLSSHHSSHLSFLSSRPASPLSINPSIATPTSPSISPASAGLPPDSNAPSPVSASVSCQRFPSHVPDVPGAIVAWDAGRKAWVLKVQNEAAYATVPCRFSAIFWNRDYDEWEIAPTQSEPGRLVWSRALGRWELLLSEHDMDVALSAPMSQFSLPTHYPEIAGYCAYDPDLRAWIYTVHQEAMASLPVAPCTIVWDHGRRVWSLQPQPPQPVDISWHVDTKAWQFALTPVNSIASHSPARRSPALGGHSSAASLTLPPLRNLASAPVETQ